MIGDAFLSIYGELRAYVIYSANQIAANETVTRLLKENQEFGKFVEAVKARDECKKQALDSFLIKPFQRVCRYPLLLKELLKATPQDWPDHAKVEPSPPLTTVLFPSVPRDMHHSELFCRRYDPWYRA